jgi:catechol 2,3-dioxygenase-like lactoylglutathione lyase family enzyme
MLEAKDVVATIAVKDVGKAREFYEGKLGLKPVPVEESGVLSFASGNSRVLVYESRYAGTNQATAATWIVGDDIEALVPALKAKGVTFERYDFPDAVHRGDLHVMGDLRAAWCKDPDGNILALVSG